MGDGVLLDKTGVLEISSINFGIVEAGSPGPIKFGYQNRKSRIVSPAVISIQQGANDLYNYLKAAIDLITLSCPYNMAIELVGQSHVLSLITYYYTVVAYNCNGRTGQSLEVSIAVADSSHAPKISWDQVLGADGYYIYRSTSSGLYTDCLITKITSGSIRSFIDTGTLAGVGSPPLENTTGGASPNYGTAPVLTYATILGLGQTKPGQQKFFWSEVDAPLTVTEGDNPRNCILRISE